MVSPSHATKRLSVLSFHASSTPGARTSSRKKVRSPSGTRSKNRRTSSLAVSCTGRMSRSLTRRPLSSWLSFWLSSFGAVTVAITVAHQPVGHGGQVALVGGAADDQADVPGIQPQLLHIFGADQAGQVAVGLRRDDVVLLAEDVEEWHGDVGQVDGAPAQGHAA